ncbi:Cacna1h [Symbiodinium natans]|uniref:Cacna1h protein n=1 Tax=Symbiodinium natans TaxID=878477 RepID=A0A812GZP6_9DINO|nr:Cacna1h [Symbiodinium natans]
MEDGHPLVPQHTGRLALPAEDSQALAFQGSGTASEASQTERRPVPKSSQTLRPEDLSFRDSWSGRLAKNERFQHTTLMVIVVNALWIFIDVQWNHSNLRNEVDGRLPLEPYSIIVENAFCAFFTAEVLIRFCAFRTYRYCMVDAWFLFDLTLVIFMVLETWVISLIDLASGGTGGGAGILNNFSSLRLLRLLRLTRMARLMRFFPELMTLVKGMVRAMQSVVFILLFMVVVTYVFAIVFTTRFGTIGFFPKDANSTLPELFPDLGSSMMTLFLYGVLADNLTYILGEIQTEDLLMMWAFMVFMVISGMTLLNMLIGVLCQVIEDSSQEESEMRQLNELKVCLVEAFTAIDESNDGTISEDEWAKIATNKRVQAALLKLGVEESMMEERLKQMQESLFGRRGGGQGEEDAPQDEDERKDGLSFDEFVEQVIDLRMDTPAGALDVEMLKSTTSSEHKTLRRRLMYVESELRKMLGVPKEAKLKRRSTSEDAAEAAFQHPKVREELREDSAASLMQHVESRLSQEEPRESLAEGLAASDAESDGWLAEVPLELLFLVLKARAAHEPPLDG